MNEKLQEALAELINLTIQGKDFVLDQAPDVITQLLAWNFTISLMGFCFGVLFLLGVPFVWFLSRNGRLRDGDNEPFFAIVYSVIGGVCGVIIMASNLTWIWIKILIAPKIFLLEYAAKLIN